MSHFDPVPCIVCGVKLYTAFDPSQNQPYKGTVFVSGGHYGSTFFDPMDGSAIEIVVCDECCEKAMQEKRIAYRKNHYKHQYKYEIYTGENHN